jgi:hypothetical protein
VFCRDSSLALTVSKLITLFQAAKIDRKQKSVVGGATSPERTPKLGNVMLVFYSSSVDINRPVLTVFELLSLLQPVETERKRNSTVDGDTKRK